MHQEDHQKWTQEKYFFFLLCFQISEAAEPFQPISYFVGFLLFFLITGGMNNFQHGKFLPKELKLA